jgi:predicted transcriptional regulator
LLPKLIKRLAYHIDDDAIMTAQADKNDDDDDIYASVLSFAKEAASKEDIAEASSISYQQLRRLTAELVDQGMLRLDVKKRVFVTTDKGHFFLQNRKARHV